MTVEEIKQKVNEIVNIEACTLQIYLIVKINGEYRLKLADIENENAMPELKNIFIDNINSVIVDNSALNLRSLSADDVLDNSLYIYDYDEMPSDMELFDNFKIVDAIKTEKFDFDNDDLSTLFGYIIYIGTMQNGVVLFKKHYPIALIKRDSFLLGVKKSKKRFEKLPGEDIIRINGSWQLIKIDEQIYVIDISVLEKNLGFTKLIEKAAQEAIDDIKKIEILDSVEALNDELENITFARKLAKIRKNSVIFKKQIPVSEIIRFSKETPALKGQFIYSESGDKIVLSTKKQKDSFLHLLNDDYLRSELTKEYYEALAKDSLIE